jgi:hypothetical protein
MSHTPSSQDSARESSSSPDSDMIYDAREITYNLRDAVVYIASQSVIDNTIITNAGNGFLINSKGTHYIVCPATLVLLPNASFTRFTTILVDISNVNGKDVSYSYLAKIVGIDGAGNIAILTFDMTHPWNKSNPELKPLHPTLQWGKSRNTSPGDRVLVIGDIIGRTAQCHQSAENAVIVGNIGDNRYVDPRGENQGELLLLSNILLRGYQSGLPVITSYGKVIGMIIEGSIALAEFFMRRSVKAFLSVHQTGIVPPRYIGFIEQVNEPLGMYYRYNKSLLGATGIIFTQLDYVIRYTETACHTINPSDLGSFPREIVGYRITSVDATSPLTPYIERGDVIVALNECPLGDRKKQIAPAMVLWRVPPGSQVVIQYRKQNDGFEKKHEIAITTISYDLYQDYPGMSPLL